MVNAALWWTQFELRSAAPISSSATADEEIQYDAMNHLSLTTAPWPAADRTTAQSKLIPGGTSEG